MQRRLIVGLAWALSLAALPVGCVSSSPAPSATGNATIDPGGTARLVVTGASPALSLQSDSPVALPLEMQSQQSWMSNQRVQPATDTLAPGVTRWWRFSGGTMVTIQNPGQGAATVQYTVREGNASVSTGGRAE